MYYYHIKEFNISDLDNLNNISYSYTKQNETILLSKMGLYKMYNDNIYKCKLNNIDSCITSVNEYVIMVSQINWKREINYQIPFDVKKIIIEKTIYNINKKLSFIIERIDKKINDFYFISKEHFINHMIKDEISSFLSQLK